MLNVMTKEMEYKVDRIAEHNKELADDIVSFLQGVGATGKKRITLFVTEGRDDGKNDTGSQ